MELVVETFVAAPPGRVFAVATDITRWPEVVTAIRSVEVLTPGPVAVGTRFRETRTMFGREESEEMEIAELSPPGRFVLTAESHGTRYQAEHTFAPDGAGTRLRLVFEGSPMTLVARLMTPMGWLMAGAIRKQLAADLDDLKRAAELSPLPSGRGTG